MNRPILHLLPNAHLDPVWLWDWREGLSEGVTTVKTILDLMDERPELTFIRGEAAIYRHIEENDPQTFARLKAQIEKGRWDVVGGVWVQPDTNLPATATLLRHFQVGGDYFASRFGARPRIGWAADSFGHSAGLPAILAASGLEGIAFSRPAPHSLPLESDAFWWQSEGEQKVLAFRITAGWYGCERDEIGSRLNSVLAGAQAGITQNYGVFLGLGNHGGGPTRRHLDDIETWRAAHPEAEVRFSTLHGFFEALRAESADLPTHQGELNSCLRGCYSSAARVKFAFRRAENAVSRAETTLSLVSDAGGALPRQKLDEAWESVLFNSFHDILPGTSIERALDEQIDWLGGALHDARKIEFGALNALARQVDTSVPEVGSDHPRAVAFLVWNPLPTPFAGQIELENCLDYRPIFSYADRIHELPLEVRGPNGAPLPFQRLQTEHDFMAHLPWRSRVLIQGEIPALGYAVYTLGWVEEASPPAFSAKVSATETSISNGEFSVSAPPGAAGIRIERNGQPFLGGEGLSALTIEDPWGSWGSLSEETDSLDLGEVRSKWRIAQTEVLESGPLRARLWVRLQPESGSSWLDLTFGVEAGRAAVDVAARVLWNERAARLKLVLPYVAPQNAPVATFQVPGGRVTRTPNGEAPGGRWATTAEFGFASDALYNFDLQSDALRATIVRATRYASDRKLGPDEDGWRPALDAGELKFRFLLAPNDENLPRLAAELEKPLTVQSVTPQAGEWPRQKSLLQIEPEQLELLSLQKSGEKWRLQLQEKRGETASVRVNGDDLGEISPFQIATFEL